MHISGELPWLYDLEIQHGGRIRDEYLVILEEADERENVGIQLLIECSLILHMPVFVKCLPFFGPDLTVQAVWWEESRYGGHRFSEGADAKNPIDEPMKEENSCCE